MPAPTGNNSEILKQAQGDKIRQYIVAGLTIFDLHSEKGSFKLSAFCILLFEFLGGIHVRSNYR